MATTPNLKIDGLDFLSIRENLKSYLESQTQFQDYNFDSSGLSVVLDILAYNTYYNSFYVNMMTTESFLSTAQRRNSVVNLARSLNYVPRSVSSARIYGNLEITTVDPANTSFVSIPKYSKFEAIVDDASYIFLTSTPLTVLRGANNQYIAENVSMIEGEQVIEKYTYVVSDPNQRFLINNANADISTLSVTVVNSATDSTTRVFNRAENILYIDGNSLIYYVEEVEDGKFEIFFGDDFLGKKLDNGNEVFLDYIVSSGPGANQIRVLNSLISDITINTIRFVASDYSFGGDERESIAKIKYNAPKTFTAQNRLVTTEDYKALMLNQPNIDAAIVWGGEDNDPPQYGKVFIAAKPKIGERLTETEKNTIIRYILTPKKLVTVNVEIVDPEYIYLILDTTVKFDSSKNVLSAASMQDLILTTIAKYNSEDISTFSKYFRLSKLTRLIDASERSILNTSISLKLRKEKSVLLGSEARYEIDFANPIDSVTSTRAANHPFNSGNKVSSNEFTYNGLQNCFMEENAGLMRIYRRFGAGYISVEPNAGTIDYETGKIILPAFNPDEFLDGGNSLKLTATPRESDILSLRSQIITIRQSDVRLSLVDDSSITLVRR